MKSKRTLTWVWISMAALFTIGVADMASRSWAAPKQPPPPPVAAKPEEKPSAAAPAKNGQAEVVVGAFVNQIHEFSLKDNSFTVDLSTLTSDRPRRDKAIREEWLESAKYPTATFVASGIAGLPADAAPGKPIAFDVKGDLTIRDITQPQRWAMTAQLDGDLLSGTATTYLLMRNFGFEPPDIGGILKVTDGVTVTVTFVAQEVQP